MASTKYVVPDELLSIYPHFPHKSLDVIHLPRGSLVSHMSVIRDEKSDEYYSSIEEWCSVPEKGKYASLKNIKNMITLCTSLDVHPLFCDGFDNICEVYRTTEDLHILDLRADIFCEDALMTLQEINKYSDQPFHGFLYLHIDSIMLVLPNQTSTKSLEKIGFVSQMTYHPYDFVADEFVNHFDGLLSNMMMGKKNYETLPDNFSSEYVVCKPYSKPETIIDDES